MIKIVRGDVVLCDLNPLIGTERSGIRPVVVLQIDRANAVSPHKMFRKRRYNEKSKDV